jgi:serine/threonine protein kinase
MIKPKDLYGKPWSEREYIIVLHYYFRYGGQVNNTNDPIVIKLSELLGRTPGSILMRFENYFHLDPETSGTRKGLSHWNDFCKKVFDEWKEKKDNLEETAKVLIRDAQGLNQPDLFEPYPVKMPKAFNKYELLDQIGSGYFGIVFSCIDTITQKSFAIKIINGDKILDKECLHRFFREIKTLRAINNVNVITIFEDNLEKESSFPAFVMDLAAYNLFDYLKNKFSGTKPILSIEESTKIYSAVLQAVKALHNNSIPVIHRDVNPNNILFLPNGVWVLADFSLAKFLPPAPVSTTFVSQTHQAWGTAYYASPEQYKSMKNTDQRSDIYSLGVLLWELFTKDDPYPDFHVGMTGLDSKLENVVLKATARQISERYNNIEELEQAFYYALNR